MKGVHSLMHVRAKEWKNTSITASSLLCAAKMEIMDDKGEMEEENRISINLINGHLLSGWRKGKIENQIKVEERKLLALSKKLCL